MSNTPVDEKLLDPLHRPRISNDGTPDTGPSHQHHRSGDEEGTVVEDDASIRQQSPHPWVTGRSHLSVHTEGNPLDGLHSTRSPFQNREEAHRLDDDLKLLKAERQVSAVEQQKVPSRSRSLGRTTSRKDEPPDDFDIDTDPVHEKTGVYKPPENPNSSAGKIFKRIHNSFWPLRYFFYIIPVVLILLIPLLLGAFLFDNATVGGVRLMWFMIWLEIVWLSLWAARVSTITITPPVKHLPLC
jgi:hypothetical protein